MKFLKSENFIIDLIFGFIFFSIGIFSLLHRKKVVSALLSSNKVFWDKMNFPPNEETSTFLTTLMIPIIGAIFLVIGILLIGRVIIFFLK